LLQDGEMPRRVIRDEHQRIALLECDVSGDIV
jgi:hypothetical protein